VKRRDRGGGQVLRDRQANRRIRLLLVLFALAFAVMFGRAVWLQAVEASHLSTLAHTQHQSTQTIPAGRGTIFDRTGVELALGEQTTTIYADPQQVKSPRAIAIAAQKILGVDPNILYPELRNRKSQFVYVQRFADPAKATKFLARHFIGVLSYPEERRAYPQNTVAAQVLGYAGVDNTGLGGLELEYNHKLEGHPGKQTVVRDPTGRAIDTISSTPVQEGANVFSTIDHTIQAQAEKILRQTVSDWDAKDASAIVLDPSTGEIYAMAQTPGYNANDTSTTPASVLRNRPVTDTYEPGSTFKLVTVTAALSEGLVTPSTRFTLPYVYQYGPCYQCHVQDAEPRPTVDYSVAQILAYSSNVGAVTIAEKLGASKLAEWVQKFGFGEPTGIDFPGESSGSVLPLDQWSETTIGNVPIGQGISVTPIQMASVYAAVANDGVWIQPHLVSRVGGRAPETWKRRRLMSPTVDREIKQMLTGVISDAGATGTEAAIPGYTVAGKTGTAQVADAHGYSSTDYTATFVGMVPASHPRLVVLVKVDDPRKSIYGGVVAAPAFQAIAKFDLQYLGVPPDDPKTLDRTALSATP
jgi:cell division protein FtsI (penicillin-binding protein 3)